MYEVYCDGQLMYNTKVDDKRYILHDAKLDLELNKAGSFDFVAHPSHAGYSLLHPLKSMITVYQDDYLIFRGRVLNTIKGFYNEKQVFCEGELAFLCDSIQRPYSIRTTVEDAFTYFIGEHNKQVDESKQFKIGNVTVSEDAGTDEDIFLNCSDEDYSTTWEAINEKLINSFGGYLWVRHEDDGNYIDYISNFDTLSNQPIKFGKNLLSIKKESKGEDIATALIPLGKDIDITQVNNGVDYIYNAEAVEKYGWIYRVETWDNITSDRLLLTKAQERLKELSEPLSSIEVSAADLSSIEDYNAFHLGTYVTADSSPHDLNANFIVKKLQITLAKPSMNKLTLDSTFKSLTQMTDTRALKSEVIRSTNKSTQTLIDTSLQLAVLVDNDGVVQGATGASADTITFSSNKIKIDSTNFKLSEEGTISAISGVIGNWVIEADTELKDYVIRNTIPSPQTVTYTTTGTDRKTIEGAYVFTVLTSNGISYVVKADVDYTSETIIVLSSFNPNTVYFVQNLDDWQGA